LIEANNTSLLVDATSPLLQNNRIPVKCINDKGLIIREGEVTWVNLECVFPTETMTVVNMDLSNEELEAKIVTVNFEYDAFTNRNKYGKSPKAILEDVKEKGYTANLESIKIKNSEATQKPYSYSVVVKIDAEEFNDKMYISPFLNESFKENPFDQESRTYPVDLTYPRKRTMRCKIIMGEGSTLDYVAEDLKVSNEMYDFEFSTSTSGNVVNVMCKFHLKKSVYPASEYDKLMWLYDQILEKVKEKVVIVKA
jgi:hypothetical protein